MKNEKNEKKRKANAGVSTSAYLRLHSKAEILVSTLTREIVTFADIQFRGLFTKTQLLIIWENL